MSGSAVVSYAAGLRSELAAAGADIPELDELVSAATALAAVLDSAPATLTQAALDDARTRWENARDAIAQHLADALLGVLAGVPGVAALAGDLTSLVREGIHGSLDLGPVHLEIASATLVVQPPQLIDGTVPDPMAVGPYPIGEVAASMDSPFGGSLPGGGSIVRMPRNADGSDGGYGGTLELPLGPAQVSAAAILSLIDGQPSFLAILGVQFLPPIQLSFGFSLDRVGGIVGVNRRADTDALRDAVRTGAGGDLLFAITPPPAPLALLTAADHFFPANRGTHLVGPSLTLSWLSFGPDGSLIGLDVGVVIEIPTGKVIILGVARASIPGVPGLLNLRLDMLGIVDPVQSLVSIDASLVDSHALGIFTLYGDAALRFSWGSQSYVVATIGGFFPGFNPEPAQLPALRRIGMSLDSPVPVISFRAEGYVAVTSNTIQFGGYFETSINAGIDAHGFIQVDAIVQFRPFHFDARISAGFDVSVAGMSFASVTLSGEISGPGPVVIHGSLSISVFLFSISWDQSFTLGSGPADVLATPGELLDLLAAEFALPANVHAAGIGDAEVLLTPRAPDPSQPAKAAVPPTGSLLVQQRRAPLGLLIERVDGRPLGSPQGVAVGGTGADVTDRFAPGSYVDLTGSEALNRPPFDVLDAGRVLTPADPALASFPHTGDDRVVQQIVIRSGALGPAVDGAHLDISHIAALVAGAGAAPAVSAAAPLVTAVRESWTSTGTGTEFTSATAALQDARYAGGTALATPDFATPVSLAGVV